MIELAQQTTQQVPPAGGTEKAEPMDPTATPTEPQNVMTPWSQLDNMRGPRVEELTRLSDSPANGDPFQSMENMYGQQTYRDALLADPEWGAKFRKMFLMNDISQDDLPGEIAFLTQIIRPNRRRLVGEMLMNTVDVMVPTTQWPVLEDAVATESSRGQQNFTSGGADISYIDLKLQNVINANDKMDRQHREDMQDSVVPAYWESLAYAHDKNLDAKYVNTITSISSSANGTGNYTDQSKNVHKKRAFEVTTSANTGATYNDIVNAHGTCDEREFDPDCVLMHTSTHTKLLQLDAYQNAEYFQSAADWRNGMIRMILDCRVFKSNAVPAPGAGKPIMWFFEKSEFAICARRRDRLITRDQDPVTLTERMSISTRNGFAIKNPHKCLVLKQKA